MDKCENRELTATETKVRRITRSVRRRKVLKTRTTYTGTKLRESPTNITDLPPELMLNIFSRLSAKDLCQCVAPVCKKWSILARHPSLRKDLSFGKDISKSDVLRLLNESPLLRRLSLKDRRDTDAILRRVCRSNRQIQTLEMEGCRGSVRRREVNGEILTRILEGCPKLCNLRLTETVVNNLDFYRTLARLGDRMRQSRIRRATIAGMICYLRTYAELHNVSVRRQLIRNVAEPEPVPPPLPQNRHVMN
jgi:hypothetical protein